MAQPAKLFRWIGILVPLALMAVATAVVLALAQPWADPAADALASLALLTVLILLPYLIPLLVQVFARPRSLVWWTTAAYTVVAGAFAVPAYASVLTSESSTAAIAMFFVPVIQLLGLAVAALVGLLTAGALRITRGRRPAAHDRHA